MKKCMEDAKHVKTTSIIRLIDIRERVIAAATATSGGGRRGSGGGDGVLGSDC